MLRSADLVRQWELNDCATDGGKLAKHRQCRRLPQSPQNRPARRRQRLTPSSGSPAKTMPMDWRGGSKATSGMQTFS